MKNPIKQMGLMLAAAVVMAAGTNCGGPKQASHTTMQRQQPPVRAVNSSPPAYTQPVSGGYAEFPSIAPVANDAPIATVASNAPVATAAPAAKTAAVAVDDELDVAIRDASDYLNDNIPKGNKIVILNVESNAANLSEYIIDELIANAVNDKNFSVVDRRQLETIQSEQKFQMSGAVADQDALRIGQFFGAQTIISGAMRDIGTRYRMTIRALSVETAQVQGQYNRNMVISETLAALAGSGGAYSRPSASATTSRTTQTATSAMVPRAVPTAPAVRGTPVPGNKLTEKLDWLKENAESGVNYLIELSANETIAPQTLAYEGKSGITITLVGVGTNRSVFLSANGNMFTINDVTLVLDNNVTLQGRGQNTKPLIHINGGTLKMNAGSAITGNSNITGNDKKGGAVYANPGTVTMNGGAIYENTANSGGGIYMESGTFTMNDGTITGNTVSSIGGGVYLGTKVIFNMKEGTISDNTANGVGGGVCVAFESAFNMRGGTISGNTGRDGGVVYVDQNATFNISGGTIMGNTASDKGGGVFVVGHQDGWHRYLGAFNKSGGTITGSNDADNGNQVLSSQTAGHAVYVACAYSKFDGSGSSPRRKEKTAGPGVNFSYTRNTFTFSGTWDMDEESLPARSNPNRIIKR
jgi:TolB-like protein